MFYIFLDFRFASEDVFFLFRSIRGWYRVSLKFFFVLFFFFLLFLRFVMIHDDRFVLRCERWKLLFTSLSFVLLSHTKRHCSCEMSCSSEIYLSYLPNDLFAQTINDKLSTEHIVDLKFIFKLSRSHFYQIGFFLVFCTTLMSKLMSYNFWG